jgi:hypothetical protein
VSAWVIPTDENRMVARHACSVLDERRGESQDGRGGVRG